MCFLLIFQQMLKCAYLSSVRLRNLENGTYIVSNSLALASPLAVEVVVVHMKGSWDRAP